MATGERDLQDDDGQRWSAHPVLATFVLVALYSAPIGVSLAAVWFVARADPLRGHRWLTYGLLSAVALGVSMLLERVLRRLVPIATLLRLTMLFPDRAPSRFKVARAAARSTRNPSMDTSGAASSAAESALALMSALAMHDRRTRGHCERVRVFCDMLAEQLKLDQSDRDRLRWASLLHDIGKLQIPTGILNKPDRLNSREFELMKSHPEVGAELTAALLPWLGEWSRGIIEHHEKYDGSGYPSGLAGPQLSRAGRIIALVDAFETMTAARSYKKAMATKTARAELARCAGTHFDPVYVRAFLGVSLPRLIWAMGPFTFVLQLPFLRVLAQAGTRTVAAGDVAVTVAGAAAIAGAGVTGAYAAVPGPAPKAHATTAGHVVRVPSPTPFGPVARVLGTALPIGPVPRGTHVHAGPSVPSPASPAVQGPAAPIVHGPSASAVPALPAPVSPVQGPPVPPVTPVRPVTPAPLGPPVQGPTVTPLPPVSRPPVSAAPSPASSMPTGATAPTPSAAVSQAPTSGPSPSPTAPPTSTPSVPPGPTPSVSQSASAAPAPTPPTVTFTSAPSGTITRHDVSLSFTSDDPAATFECRLDNGSWLTCGTPTGYTLANGAHTVDVRARGVAGSGAPARAAFTVAAPPVATIITGPAAGSTVSSNDIALFLSADDPAATFQCSTDGTTFSPCPSTPSLRLPNGPGQVWIRAVGAAGTGPVVTTGSFTIAAPLPVITLTHVPTATYDTATFDVATTDPSAIVTCRLDSGSTTGCGGPQTYSGLSVGPHTVTVIATDPLSGTSSASVTFTSYASPVVTITSAKVAGSTATVSFTGTDATSFECSLDGGAWTACSSPASLLSLAPGSHVLAVRGVGPAGPGAAVQAGPLAVGALTTFTTAPSGAVLRPVQTFAISPVAGASGYECTVDGAAALPCSNPVSLTFAGGSHTVQMSAVVLGVAQNPATTTFTIVPSMVTFTSTPPASTSDKTATFAFTASPGLTFECGLDGGAWAACASPATYAQLTKGAHTFRVRARDSTGATGNAFPYSWQVK